MESQLAVVGGTMGLLTGFSILSGVEILYFAAKLIMSRIKIRWGVRKVRKAFKGAESEAV